MQPVQSPSCSSLDQVGPLLFRRQNRGTNNILLIHMHHFTTVTMAAPVLTITEAFNDYDSFADLLQRIGVTAVCRTRLVDEEGIDSATELTAITMKDLQSTVDNVNKLFGNTTGGGRIIYFAPNRVTRIKAVGLFFKRCLTINAIPDICLITLNKSMEFVLKLPAWTEKADDIDDIVKQKGIIPLKQPSSKHSGMSLKPYCPQHEERVASPLNM